MARNFVSHSRSARAASDEYPRKGGVSALHTAGAANVRQSAQTTSVLATRNSVRFFSIVELYRTVGGGRARTATSPHQSARWARRWKPLVLRLSHGFRARKISHPGGLF